MKWRRVFVYFAIAMGFASAACAEVTITEGKEGEPTVIRMTVTPAAEPKPALRYRLVVRDVDLQPGNAAPYYYRAMINFSSAIDRQRKTYGDEFDDWCIAGGTPLSKLPLDKLRKANHTFDDYIRYHLAVATKRSHCDWELGIDQLRGVDVISFMLPEFQECRELSRVLVLRTRLAVAERRYDDAIDLMRMNYRMGRDVSQPFLVCGLIGIAIDGMANRSLVELIANPDSPNMYWAIGELPKPPIDLRPAVRFEMDFGPRMFPVLHNASTTEHSPQEWNRLFTETIRDLQAVGGSSIPFHSADSKTNPVTPGLAATALALTGYTHAKERLIAEGMDRAQVEKMAVGQVIAIYTERNYRRFADDWENLWQLPFSQSRQAAQRLDKKLDEAAPFRSGVNREVLPLVTLLLPALQASREAQARLEREVAAIRVIEAIRMHAAHNGRLPERLDEIDAVPVPENPATGKPFAYRLEGTTAILELPASDKIASGNCRYEIRIAAKK